jgi:hypothetical protein
VRANYSVGDSSIRIGCLEVSKEDESWKS